jgi:hypothetical protein
VRGAEIDFTGRSIDSATISEMVVRVRRPVVSSDTRMGSPGAPEESTRGRVPRMEADKAPRTQGRDVSDVRESKSAKRARNAMDVQKGFRRGPGEDKQSGANVPKSQEGERDGEDDC